MAKIISQSVTRMISKEDEDKKNKRILPSANIPTVMTVYLNSVFFLFAWH